MHLGRRKREPHPGRVVWDDRGLVILRGRRMWAQKKLAWSMASCWEVPGRWKVPLEHSLTGSQLWKGIEAFFPPSCCVSDYRVH